MLAFIRLSNLEYPLHEGDIRLEHPEITEDQTGDTFPCPSTFAVIELNKSVANSGYYLVKAEAIPPGDPRNTSTKGYWQASYNEIAYTAEELALIKQLKDERDARIAEEKKLLGSP